MQNLAAPLQGGALGQPPLLDPPAEREAASAPGEQPWEMVMDKKQFKLWRRPIEGTHLYQYRGDPPCPCPPPPALPCPGKPPRCGADPRRLSFHGSFWHVHRCDPQAVL